MLDALNYETQPEQEISLKQLAMADEVVVTKAENFQPAEREMVKKWTGKVNPLARNWFSEKGKTEDFDLFSIQKQNRLFTDRGKAQLHAAIQTKTFNFSAPLNRREFTRWLAYNLDVYKKEIYRVKGILCFENEPFDFVIQGVGGSFEITEGENLAADGMNQLVFIGQLDGLPLDYFTQ
jgi:G3E family GTPase